MKQGLSGLEIEFDRRGNMGPVVGPSQSVGDRLSHLDFFLRHSASYTAWMENRKRLASRFDSILEDLVHTGEVREKEALEIRLALENLSLSL